MLSRTEVYDWSKSFKESLTEVEDLRRLPSAGKVSG